MKKVFLTLMMAVMAMAAGAQPANDAKQSVKADQVLAVAKKVNL